MNWVGHVARVGGRRNSCGVLVNKSNRKMTAGRAECRREDNIKVNRDDEIRGKH